MPLEKIINRPGDTTLGIWRIEESEEDLISRLQLDESEKALIAGLQHSKRYLHWLGSRVLLRTMLNTDKFIALKADERNKPYIENFPHKVSITHSGIYAAVMISRQYETGVDIEGLTPKILNVNKRFLSPPELELLEGLDEKSKIYRSIIFWCVKEALYKLYAKGQMIFRDHLLINSDQEFSGPIVEASILKEDCQKTFLVEYAEVNNYLIAFVAGQCDN